MAYSFFYVNYLGSESWRRRRADVYLARAGLCERCGRELRPEMAHVHHRSYARLGDEEDQDLVLCCAQCHHSLDAERREARKRQEHRAAVARLAVDFWGWTWKRVLNEDDAEELYQMRKSGIKRGKYSR